MLNEYLNKMATSLPRGLRISTIKVNEVGLELLRTLTVEEKEQKDDILGYIGEYTAIPVIVDAEQEILLSVEYVKSE